MSERAREVTSSGPRLVDATADQERRFRRAFAIVEEAIARKAFPGAALAVTLGDELVAWRGFGRFTYEADAAAVTRETVWDLASLTKVLATTAMAMLLWERGRLALDARVVEVLPDFGGYPDRDEVTVRMLLAHSSGLPAHRKLYLEHAGRVAILEAAKRVPLEAAPMSRAEYSDIGFIVLGELLEKVAGRGLDGFCAEEVFRPLKLTLSYRMEAVDTAKTPPTAIDTEYRHRLVQGEVNDENAWAMGRVAGHAGLFGDVLSVARFARVMLAGGAPVFRAGTVEMFTRREERPKGTSRALGWDTPSRPSSSGKYFSERAFGHLGYTGTSLWCDPERGLSVTLLTNRTWPDAKNQAIREVRPAVHDAVVEALDAE